MPFLRRLVQRPAGAALPRLHRASCGCSARRSTTDAATVAEGAVAAAGEPEVWSFTATRKLFPEGLPDLIDHANIYNNQAIKRQWRKEQARMPKEMSMLRRKKAEQVIGLLGDAEAQGTLDELAPGLLLTGGAGSGKSLSLLHIVHWARSAGWLVCYIPNARQWTHGQYWEPHPYIPESMVQVDLAYNFLSSFAAANAALLDSVPLQHELSFDDSAPPGVETLGPAQGHTLADLMEVVPRFNDQLEDEPEHMLNVDAQIIVVAEHLKKELYEQRALPFLMAIDQLNFLFDQSGYRELEGKGSITPPVPVSRLRMCELFLDFQEQPPVRAAPFPTLYSIHHEISPQCLFCAGEWYAGRCGVPRPPSAGRLGQAPRLGRRPAPVPCEPLHAGRILDHAASLACVPILPFSFLFASRIGRIDRLSLGWLGAGEEGLMSQDVDEQLYARAVALTQNNPRGLHRWAHRN